MSRRKIFDAIATEIDRVAADGLHRALGLHVDLALGLLDESVGVGAGLHLHLVGEAGHVERVRGTTISLRRGPRTAVSGLGLHLLQLLPRLAGVVQRLCG